MSNPSPSPVCFQLPNLSQIYLFSLSGPPPIPKSKLPSPLIDSCPPLSVHLGVPSWQSGLFRMSIRSRHSSARNSQSLPTALALKTQSFVCPVGVCMAWPRLLHLQGRWSCPMLSGSGPRLLLSLRTLVHAAPSVGNILPPTLRSDPRPYTSQSVSRVSLPVPGTMGDVAFIV